jgi:hypothetical protein
MNQKPMPCALCLQDRKLCHSHIIPEFLYEALYDEKHRIQVLSVLPHKGNWREQKGLREHLLCEDCEQKISVWENYASLLLRGGVPISYKRDGSIVFISDLDYNKFRLFQLSVVWRAGISKQNFFSNIQLGNHAELLRNLLLDSNPGNPRQYCCIMFGLKHEETTLTDLIMQPGKIRIQGQIVYRFIFGGFMWVFFVSNQNLPTPFLPCSLQPPGIAAFVVRDAIKMKNLVSFCTELNHMGRAPA